VDALFFDIGLNQFKFLNGRTTSRNNKEQLVTIRRVALQMMVDLNINTLSLLSSQNDESLRALVASSFDSYLSSRVTSGWIQNFRPTICDVSNNPLSSQTQNRLNISISYTPYFPADIIVIDVIQQFSIGI
jgi:phage tail sheath protein FI